MVTLVTGRLMNLYTQAPAEEAGARLATFVLCLFMLGGIAVSFGLLRLVYLQQQRRQLAEGGEEEAQKGPAPEDDAAEE